MDKSGKRELVKECQDSCLAGFVQEIGQKVF